MLHSNHCVCVCCLQAKGGKDKGPAVSSHNNEKDFARRADAYNKLRQEDKEDLEIKITAAKELWELQQAEAAEERARQEAEARTLRARRRRAKEALAATGALGETGAHVCVCMCVCVCMDVQVQIGAWV